MDTTSKNLSTWQALTRSHRRLHTHLETALKANGLPGLDVLDLLAELYQADEHLTAKALEKRLLMPQYGISRLLDRAEREGLVSRIADTRDKRVKHLKLSGKGRTTLAEMVKTRTAALETFLSPRAKPGQLERMTDLLALLDQDLSDPTSG